MRWLSFCHVQCFSMLHYRCKELTDKLIIVSAHPTLAYAQSIVGRPVRPCLGRTSTERFPPLPKWYQEAALSYLCTSTVLPPVMDSGQHAFLPSSISDTGPDKKCAETVH